MTETTASKSEIIRQKLALDEEFRQYVKQHGFDAAEYFAPTPGSWYESYLNRRKELEAQLLKSVH
ncbi:MAG: hypothetical protein NZ524_09475 [Thiobacillaceae bacterium]|nr:hypothetical protein [Thiobacillaceae bacterium]MCX7673775.1 hypothetical protein [Thiobacillaceae bacterium]MDW8323341.1 hypothetical protein [Burkholderiales bacterium]